MYVLSYPYYAGLLNTCQTAALGLFNGLKIQLPDLDNLPEEKSEDESEPESKSPPLEKGKEKEDAREGAAALETDAAPKNDAAIKPEATAAEPSTETKTEPKKEDEWVVVLGGASSVGKYAIQVSCHTYHITRQVY
jgi:hypothetical protein